MVEVFAAKGPLAGRRIELPEDQVAAATAEGGWALKLEPGVQLLPDPGAPYDKSWKIPGYTEADLAPFVDKGPSGKTTDIKEGQAKTTDAKTATSSVGSTSTQTAPVSGKEPAEETNGDDKAAAEEPKTSSTERTTTKTSQK